jgi:AcrR family transcriptional regulator
MRKEDRRRLVLEAARSVFAAKGYHATGVADIIAACGVARGTFYLYFESKRRIFEVLVDEFVAVLKERVLRVDDTVGLAGITEQLRGNVLAVLATFAENPELARILFNEAVGLDKGFDGKLSEFYGEMMDMVQASVALGQEMGLVRPLDTRVIAACVLGSVKEVQQRILKGNAGVDLDHVVDELLAFHVRALFVPELLREAGA